MQKKKPYPSETQQRYIVRFPDGMRDRINAAAKVNNRSMNSEIVARLEASFEESDLAPDARTLESLIDARVENAVKKALADYFDHLPKSASPALAKAVAKKD